MKKKFKIITKSGKSIFSQSVTIVDPATGWKEIRTVPSVGIILYLTKYKKLDEGITYYLAR